MHVLSSLLLRTPDFLAQSTGASVGMVTHWLLELAMPPPRTATWLVRVCLVSFVVDLEDFRCTRGMPIRLSLV
jgi:hypothetical protein